MIIDKKYLLFSLKLPFSKKIYIKDLSTIYYKHTKIALCFSIGHVFCDMNTYTTTAAKLYRFLKKIVNCKEHQSHASFV